jgi:Family of unknown function (DUF6153)
MVEEMSNRHRRSRAPVASPCGLLLLALTMLGLFAMHGVQAETSPVDTHPAASVITVFGMSDMGTETGHRTPPSHHAPVHEHPGGQVCLAIVVMAALLILGTVFIGRSEHAVRTGAPARREHDHQGRAPPPPSILQLSVLRL